MPGTRSMCFVKQPVSAWYSETLSSKVGYSIIKGEGILKTSQLFCASIHQQTWRTATLVQMKLDFLIPNSKEEKKTHFIGLIYIEYSEVCSLHLTHPLLRRSGEVQRPSARSRSNKQTACRQVTLPKVNKSRAKIFLGVVTEIKDGRLWPDSSFWASYWHALTAYNEAHLQS